MTTDNDRAHQYLAQAYRQEGLWGEAEHHLTEAARIQSKRLRSAVRFD